MDDDFVYLYIDSSQKLKIYILDNLESQFRAPDVYIDRNKKWDLIKPIWVNAFKNREEIE